MRRRRVKVYESPSPEERRRLEQHRLDALEQHRVRAHTDRGWPTADERRCPTCGVLSATSLCWRCGADLSVLPVTQGTGSAPASRRDPRPGVAAPRTPDGSASAGRGTSSNSRPAGRDVLEVGSGPARVAGNARPGPDATERGV